MSAPRSRKPKQRRIFYAALVAALIGLAHVGHGLFIQAKAMTAQVLLRSAWDYTLIDGGPHKPWSWADTWPVAEVYVPSLGKRQIVLDGTSGQALAFGPGLMHAMARPGDDGLSIIAAHRDTHFRFLKDLSPGDLVKVTNDDGTVVSYAVTETKIVRYDDSGLYSIPGKSQLALVTCYPFDAAFRGPERYVVLAEQMAIRPERLP